MQSVKDRRHAEAKAKQTKNQTKLTKDTTTQKTPKLPEAFAVSATIAEGQPALNQSRQMSGSQTAKEGTQTTKKTPQNKNNPTDPLIGDVKRGGDACVPSQCNAQQGLGAGGMCNKK